MNLHVALNNFYGSEVLYIYRLFGRKEAVVQSASYGPLRVRYTQGVQFLASEGNARWLLDAVVSHLPKVMKHPDYEAKHFWVLTPQGRGAVLACYNRDTYTKDGPKGEPLVKQAIPYTAFEFPQNDKGFQPFIFYGGATVAGGEDGEPVNIVNLWLRSEN